MLGVPRELAAERGFVEGAHEEERGLRLPSGRRTRCRRRRTQMPDTDEALLRAVDGTRIKERHPCHVTAHPFPYFVLFSL